MGMWGGGAGHHETGGVASTYSHNTGQHASDAIYPTGPSTQYLGTWDWGNSNFSTGFGEVYDYWVLGPLGI